MTVRKLLVFLIGTGLCVIGIIVSVAVTANVYAEFNGHWCNWPWIVLALLVGPILIRAGMVLISVNNGGKWQFSLSGMILVVIFFGAVFSGVVTMRNGPRLKFTEVLLTPELLIALVSGISLALRLIWWHCRGKHRNIKNSSRSIKKLIP